MGALRPPATLGVYGDLGAWKAWRGYRVGIGPQATAWSALVHTRAGGMDTTRLIGLALYIPHT